jgi:hypothetical protein
MTSEKKKHQITFTLLIAQYHLEDAELKREHIFLSRTSSGLIVYTSLSHKTTGLYMKVFIIGNSENHSLFLCVCLLLLSI